MTIKEVIENMTSNRIEWKKKNTCDGHKIICWGSITDPKTFGIKACFCFLNNVWQIKKKKIIIFYFFYKICQQEIHIREIIISI